MGHHTLELKYGHSDIGDRYLIADSPLGIDLASEVAETTGGSVVEKPITHHKTENLILYRSDVLTPDWLVLARAMEVIQRAGHSVEAEEVITPAVIKAYKIEQAARATGLI
jgi:hypothetical protein